MAGPPNRIQYIFGVYHPVTGQLLGVTPSGNTPYAAVAGNMNVAATLAQLRQTLGTTASTVLVQGLNAPGDGGGGTYVLNPTDVSDGAWFTATCAGTLLTVTSVNNGTVSVGQTVSRGDTGATIGVIASPGTGTGGVGTYNLTAPGATFVTNTICTADTGTSPIVGFDGSRWTLLQGARAFPTTTGEQHITVSGIPVANYIKNLLYEPGNAFRYGAAGDGVTDDTIALQCAVAIASSDVNPSSNAYFPRPQVRFLFTSPLTINNSIKFRGDGKYASFLRYTGTGAAITTGTIIQTNLQVSFEGFSLEITGSGAIGIDASRLQNSSFQSVRIANSSNNGNISGINQSASAVITLSNGAASNPFANGQTVLIGGVTGMTQINGLIGVVTGTGGSAGAWTVTVNINSTAFSAYVSGGTVFLSQIGIQANENNNNTWLSFFSVFNDVTCDSIATGIQLTGAGANLASKNLANRWRLVAPTFLSCGNCIDLEAVSGVQIVAPYFDQNALAAVKTGPGTNVDGVIISAPTMETESGGYFFDIDPTTNRLSVYGNRYFGGSLFKNSNGILGTRARYDGQWDEGIQWTDAPTLGTITAITAANPAVVTINTVSGTNPFSLNETVYLSGVNGMAQINGLTGVVSAVGGVSGAWTISVNINASAFSAYTSGGTLLSGFVTLNQMVPSGQTLTVPKNPLAVPAMAIGDTTDATVNITIGRLTIAVGKSFISGAAELFTTLGTNSLHLGTTGTGSLGLWTGDVQRLSISGSTGNVSVLTSGGANTQLLGTITNDNAAAGITGEFATATVASGSATALTTATPKTVTSISLTAGDWDVSGTVDYTIGATTSVTQLQAGISLTTNTLASQAGGSGLGTDPTSSIALAAEVPTALPFAQPTPVVRVSLSATTTVFLVTSATFTVSTISAYGTLRARRVR